MEAPHFLMAPVALIPLKKERVSDACLEHTFLCIDYIMEDVDAPMGTDGILKLNKVAKIEGESLSLDVPTWNN